MNPNPQKQTGPGASTPRPVIKQTVEMQKRHQNHTAPTAFGNITANNPIKLVDRTAGMRQRAEQCLAEGVHVESALRMMAMLDRRQPTGVSL